MVCNNLCIDYYRLFAKFNDVYVRRVDMGLIFTDIPELYDSKTEIVLSNLSDLERSFEIFVEKRLGHLSELSKAVILDGEDFDIIKSIFLSIRSGGGADSENIIEENRRDADFIYANVIYAKHHINYRM